MAPNELPQRLSPGRRNRSVGVPPLQRRKPRFEKNWLRKKLQLPLRLKVVCYLARGLVNYGFLSCKYIRYTVSLVKILYIAFTFCFISSLPSPAPTTTVVDSVPMCRILYRCELFDEEASYPKAEMEARIESFLTAQLQECPMEAAALMIKTLNRNPEKIQTCVDTIKKIIQVSAMSRMYG